MDFKQLQEEVAVWSGRNFGMQPRYFPLLGAVEEIGELSHAFLKGAQDIRKSEVSYEEKEKDAVADIIIYLADFCERSGFSMQRCVETAWEEVKQRDWKKNAQSGKVEQLELSG